MASEEWERIQSLRLELADAEKAKAEVAARHLALNSETRRAWEEYQRLIDKCDEIRAALHSAAEGR